MSKIIKAKVTDGRYKGEIVRISNISVSDSGKKYAACTLANNQRINLPLNELEVIDVKLEVEIPKARTASMPFISGSTSSRTMTHTKKMNKPRIEKKAATPSRKKTMAICEICKTEYNQEDRKGMAGKITQCENCAEETEIKMEGTMIFSHKTGATIEIKKDGQLKHEADSFDYKGK